MTRRPRKKEHESLKDRLNIRETILICEGPQDEGVLKKVLRAIEKEVLIIPGGGKETVSPLMSAFRASERRDAFSIEDRDFRDTDSEGHGLLSSTDVKNRWLRHDIEAYLLYPDWLVEAGRLSKKRALTEDEAWEAVLAICRELVIFHAGQKTLASLPKWHQGSLRAEDQWDAARWREALADLFADTRKATRDYDARLGLWDWRDTFEGYVQRYQHAADSLTEALKSFSGKKIINKLAARGWGREDDLRLALTEHAGTYAAQVGLEKLRDDERLGDFGRLERVMLLGFSQGACLALEYAARHPRRYGDVVALSGGLIGTDEELIGHEEDSLAGVPIFLGCSDADAHIPLARVQRSAEILKQMGARVDERTYPDMGHTINQDEIDAVQAMMKGLAI